MRTRHRLALTAAAVLVLLAANAEALDFVESRGDFYYDAEGRFAGVRHTDFPQDFERRPLSHREKLELLGLRLPDRPAVLEPRWVAPKPARVDEHEGLRQDRIVVKFAESATVRLRDGRLDATGASIAAFEEVLAAHPAADVVRLFSTDETILAEDKDSGERISGRQLADLNNYYLIRLPAPGPDGAALANELLRLDVVETAYLLPEAEPPVCTDVAPTTPLWESSQFYLDPAPAGVDAFFAWDHHPGGDGAGSSFWVIDCEWAWCFTHEDLDIDVTDVVNGSVNNNFSDHGTAVTAEYGACDNEYGVTGISHDISVKMSDFDAEPSWASNISTAASFLSPGEIILLEIHIPGPDTGDDCVCNCGQFEYVPVEWEQASFDAIETATANGIVVVEAGGNGSIDLDDAVYQNKFNLMVRDSGAILVGAGRPGSHSPECWTNHGRRIDCHGYGSSVVTGGYGNLFNQSGCTQDYTDSFSGTSSASPIIVGACASLQGIANEKLGYDVSPTALRDLIKVGGTPQGPPTTKIIRALPNLAEAIVALETPTAVPEAAAIAATTNLTTRPNPFRLDTVIRYDVRRDGSPVRVTVHDVRGRRVATLVDEERPAGLHSVEWNGRDSNGLPVGTGVYFVRLETDGAAETRKIAHVR